MYGGKLGQSSRGFLRGMGPRLEGSHTATHAPTELTSLNQRLASPTQSIGICYPLFLPYFDDLRFLSDRANDGQPFLPITAPSSFPPCMAMGEALARPLISMPLTPH